MTALRRVVYTSRASEGLNEADIRAILGASRMLNRRHDITGLLLFTGEHFLQVLEGHPESLMAKLASIERDPRHDEFQICLVEGVTIREYDHWSMPFVHDSALAEDIRRIHHDGCANGGGVAKFLQTIHAKYLAHGRGSDTSFSTDF